MSPISYEDRTQETPEETSDRQALGPAFQLANTAHLMSGGDADMTTRALAAALGLAGARSEETLDEVFNAVRRHYDKAKTAIAEHEFRVHHRHADA